LTLPKGRTTVFNDDPGRKEFGIMRHCERTLKRRGVNVYPCLIDSMQKLTKRGMELAETFRKLGIPVIESYPGAAQDIMKIPRKRASLEYLEKGLANFGIEGEYTRQTVSHDELDAITSALVGLFFWSGRFERLGTIEEDYLIIPDLNVGTFRPLAQNYML
jgi:predicted nuclease with RNAse H fold